MKNFSPVLLFFILMFVYTKAIGPIPFTVHSITTTKTDSFSVSGEGTYAVTPDIATFNAGVMVNGTSIKQVQTELNNKINAVTDAIKKTGVGDKDIKTTNYNINPSYDYRNGSQKIIGYQANTNLFIKIRDIDNTNATIDAATAAGANEISGISFDVDDKTKAEDEARKLAVEKAKTKAEHAAQIAGFRLGAILNYNESFGNVPRPMMFSKTEMLAPADSAAPTEIEPGNSEITVTVTLTYELN